MALLQPVVERKKQQEVDRKVAETLLLEEFLGKLKDRHRNTINELQSQIKVIDTDLERAKDKRNVVYMDGVEDGSPPSNNADNNDSSAELDLKRRAGHKRKIQVIINFG